jgi:hypothetical protein
LAIIVVLSALEARAQCPFPHPAKAAKFRAEFVQAFFPCKVGPDSCCLPANGMTESNVPSCVPAETFLEANGSQPSSWLWGPKSRGSISLTAKGGDVQVSVQLSDVHNGSGPATSNGAVSFFVRATLFDPMTGMMTAVDLPLGFPLSVVNGKGKLKSTLSSLAGPYAGLVGVVTGACTSMELIVPAVVRDPGGVPFATTGFFLP